MYITYYKTHNSLSKDFNSIMETEYTEPIHSYSLTIKVDNPTPKTKLPSSLLNRISQTTVTLRYCRNLLRPYKDNHNEQYYTFQIPKRSGGSRTIYAPLPEFKEKLTRVLEAFLNDIKCLPHTAAYAYVKNRSIKDANAIHQKNDSKWFLHLDLKDFFPSCTVETVYNALCQVFPFYYLSDIAKADLYEIIDICSLNGALPQGSPISPYFSNLVMIPIDYALHNYLKRNNDFYDHFAYTRYADDFTISCKSTFDWQALIEKIKPMLAPFTIKDSKTHYGSRAGSNWNLGLMLNKDNNITLGYKKKRILNAMLNNFLQTFADPNKSNWSRNDTYQLQGQLSFLKYIEPEYFNHILHKYEQKYNTSYATALKTIL